MLRITHGVFLFSIRKDPFHRLLALGILVHYLFYFAQQVVFGHYRIQVRHDYLLAPVSFPLFHLYTPRFLYFTISGVRPAMFFDRLKKLPSRTGAFYV